VLLACAAIVYLMHQYSRDRERQRSLRGAFFKDCMSLFPTCKVVQDDVQFPVLTGRYNGFAVKLEPILDDMTVRKLPSLWLRVSLYAPVPYAGVFDLLARPRGNEFYSPAYELPLEVRAPSGWPADAVIRSDDPEQMPPVATLAPHLHLFDDVKMKEMLVAGGGVRLVYQFDQAERAEYSVLRQSYFVKSRLTPDLARGLLEAATAIYQSVAVVPAQTGTQAAEAEPGMRRQEVLA
jgi:hypothetical protein